MNVKTHLVSLHRRYKNLEYHHHEQAEQSADITQRISHEARANVYSAAADDLPRNAKRPVGAGTPASLQRDDGLNAHHPEG